MGLALCYRYATVELGGPQRSGFRRMTSFTRYIVAPQIRTAVARPPAGAVSARIRAPVTSCTSSVLGLPEATRASIGRSLLPPARLLAIKMFPTLAALNYRPTSSEGLESRCTLDAPPPFKRGSQLMVPGQLRSDPSLSASRTRWSRREAAGKILPGRRLKAAIRSQPCWRQSGRCTSKR